MISTRGKQMTTIETLAGAENTEARIMFNETTKRYHVVLRDLDADANYGVFICDTKDKAIATALANLSN